MAKLESHLKKYTTDEVLSSLGVFSVAEAIEAGISQPTISRLAAKRQLIRLDHGLYHHINAEIDHETLNFVVACCRLGEDSVIGGLTALFHYGLIPQVPQQIWILIPHVNRGKFSQYRVLHTKHEAKIGTIDYGKYRFVTIERAIVEAFRYASKMGYQTALTAARTALREQKTSEQSLHDTAKQLGLWQVMVKNWEAITTK